MDTYRDSKFTSFCFEVNQIPNLRFRMRFFFGSKSKLTENPKNEVRNSNEAGKNSYQRRIQPYYPLIWSFFDQISAKKQLKKLQKWLLFLFFVVFPASLVLLTPFFAFPADAKVSIQIFRNIEKWFAEKKCKWLKMSPYRTLKCCFLDAYQWTDL